MRFVPVVLLWLSLATLASSASIALNDADDYAAAVEDDAMASTRTNNNNKNDNKQDLYCADDDDAATPCSNAQHNSQSWFEDASQEGMKFLQQHVFGQKPAQQPNHRHPRRHDQEQQQRSESFAHLTTTNTGHGSNTAAATGTKEETDDAASSSGDTDDASPFTQAKSMWDSLSSILQSDRPDEALLRLLLSTDTADVNEGAVGGGSDGASGGGGGKRKKDDDEQDDTSTTTTTTTSASVPTVWSAWMDTKQLFLDHAKEMLDQLQRTFGERLGALLDDHFHLPAVWFYLRQEQERKNAAWKRRQHRFHPTFASDTAKLKELHQALYLSQLSYESSEQTIRRGLAQFDDNSWELLYCDTQGIPSEPAHFLAVQKQAAPLHPKNQQQQQDPHTQPPTSLQQPNQLAAWWRRHLHRTKNAAQPYETEYLKVFLVIRGTKTVGDVLSDGLLEPVPYRDKYQAHGGIKKSGEYMVAKHLERLSNLLQASGRSKLQLFLFGHSLGAGTAAIAAIEFNDYDFIDVHSVGFGCPSLLSPELSEQYKDIITTVVSDADVIPRMSGASLVNLQLNMMQFDWTDFFLEEMDLLLKDILEDITDFTNGKGTSFVTDIMDKIRTYFVASFDEDVRPSVRRAREVSIPEKIPGINGTHQMPVELIPPGTCIHVYRNGVGYDATYTPCSFFSEIEFVPNFVADHLVKSGYHWALLSLLRQQEQDYNAVFENEV